MRSYKTIKTMCYNAPDVLHALLSHLAEQTAAYVKFQIDSGAQCMQVKGIIRVAHVMHVYKFCAY